MMLEPREDSEDVEIQKLVEKAAMSIGEHVDTIQIFVTRQAEGSEATKRFSYGSGNFYARLGHVHEWLVIQEEHARAYARREDEEEG